METVYEKIYKKALEMPEDFWADAAQAVQWEKKWDKVFDDSNYPFVQWFKGGLLNSCYNALDFHVEMAGLNRLH